MKSITSLFALRMIFILVSKVMHALCIMISSVMKIILTLHLLCLVLDCHPNVSEVKKLIHELNATNGLYRFVRTMRAKFQEVSAVGIDLIFYTLWYNGIGEGMEWNGSFHSILLSLPLGVGVCCDVLLFFCRKFN